MRPPLNSDVSPSFFTFPNNVYLYIYNCQSFSPLLFSSSLKFLDSSSIHQTHLHKPNLQNISTQFRTKTKQSKKQQQKMCFTLIGTLVCRCCQRAISEVATGATTFCQSSGACGRFVSKKVDEQILGICVVCESGQEQRRMAVAQLNRAFKKK